MGDWIHLERIKFPCKIGTYWAEHQREQPLELSVHFGLDLTHAAVEDLSHSIDYGQVLLQVELIARHGGWRLLETLGTVLVRWFLLEPSPGEARAVAGRVKVSLSKPEACGGRAVPTVEIERSRSELKVKHVDLGSGVRQLIVGETQWVTVSRVELPANTQFRPAQGAWVLPLTGNDIRGATSLDGQARWVDGDLAAQAEPAAWLMMQGPAARQAAR
ncbi:MAG TPA: dihydroneopterin aldolase [Polyangiaceae bacterium]|nr:dihydroneopterin aldolase [Polyangiaceae bacterium]